MFARGFGILALKGKARGPALRCLMANRRPHKPSFPPKALSSARTADKGFSAKTSGEKLPRLWLSIEGEPSADVSEKETYNIATQRQSNIPA